MSDITGHYVDVDGTRTYYEEAGDGVPMVCIHTAGANCLEWKYALPLLAEEGIRAIALDLPGHAHSDPVDWEPIRDMHEYAEFVWSFTRTVLGDQQDPVITGCSIGGDMTLDLAVHHSADCQAVIPMEGAARTPTFPDVSSLENPANVPGWQDMLERAATGSLNWDASDQLITETRWMHRNAQKSAVGDLQAWAGHDVRGRLGDIECPVLYIVGDEDFYVPKQLIDETRQELPAESSRTLVLEGIGHYPMLEDPQGYVDHLSGFLRTHDVL